jgi:hypothetical protein
MTYGEVLEEVCQLVGGCEAAGFRRACGLFDCGVRRAERSSSRGQFMLPCFA